MCLTTNPMVRWKRGCRNLAAILVLCSVCFNSQASEEKTITVNSGANQASLEFSFNPYKPSFDISEPLKFNLRANQDIFLYVYTVNPDGTYALILPNQAQSGNKYPANTPMTVPNRNIAFMADGNVAAEPVYAIASTRYIDLELAKQKRAGDFVILQPDDMRRRFGSKGIVLRDLQAGEAESQIVVANEIANNTVSTASSQSGSVSTIASSGPPSQPLAEARLVRIDVPVHNVAPAVEPANEQPAIASAAEPVMTFVATDRDSYREGDTVHILFGASEQGAVALYFIDPDGSGSDTPITTRDVDGNGFVRVSATHHGSRGSHMIRAEFIPPAGGNKSLRLNDDSKQVASSVVRIDVTN